MSSPKKAPAQKPSDNRRKLLDAAREIMTVKGYAETGTEEIVARAGVTRGALYYQFADKQDLFLALCQELAEALGLRVFEETMARITHDREDLAVGLEMMLDAFLEPDIQRLLLRDGPAVLGFETWKGLVEPINRVLVEHALQHLLDDGTLAPQPLEPIAVVMSGAMIQAGQAIAASPDPKAAREAYGQALSTMVAGIMSGSAAASAK